MVVVAAAAASATFDTSRQEEGIKEGEEEKGERKVVEGPFYTLLIVVPVDERFILLSWFNPYFDSLSLR